MNIGLGLLSDIVTCCNQSLQRNSSWSAVIIPDVARFKYHVSCLCARHNQPDWWQVVWSRDCSCPCSRTWWSTLCTRWCSVHSSVHMTCSSLKKGCLFQRMKKGTCRHTDKRTHKPICVLPVYVRVVDVCVFAHAMIAQSLTFVLVTLSML